MNIQKISAKPQNPRINFQGFKVAEAGKKLNSEKDLFLYRIDKKNDMPFVEELRENILISPEKRFRLPLQNIRNFLSKAFDAINDKHGYTTILGVNKDKPVGIMVLNEFNKSNLIHLNYFATWSPKNENHVKDCGTMFMRHLLDRGKNSKKIELVPAFHAEIFYSKFGFDFKDEYLPYEMTLSQLQIPKRISILDSKLQYNAIENNENINLYNVATPE